MKTFETVKAASSHCSTPLRLRWRQSSYSNWAAVKSVWLKTDRQITAAAAAAKSSRPGKSRHSMIYSAGTAGRSGQKQQFYSTRFYFMTYFVLLSLTTATGVLWQPVISASRLKRLSSVYHTHVPRRT